MKTRTIRILLCILMAPVISWCSESTAMVSLPELAKTCRHLIFPEPEEYPSEMIGTSGMRSIVVYVRDECDREWRAVLSQTDIGGYEVTVKFTRGGNVRSQLSSLVSENPGLGVEGFCSRITTGTISRGQDAKLQELAAAFEDLRVSPSIDAPFVVGGTYYRVWIYAALNHAYFEFYGLPGEREESSNPLQVWVDDLASMLKLGCPIIKQ